MEQFTEKGLYDGLFLMSDARTGTYWNHMTGEAVYGPLAGKRLELENVLHTTVAQVLEADPDAVVAISDHPKAASRVQPGNTLSRLLSRITDLMPMFTRTMGTVDARRPKMDIGTGIWRDSLARYYSLEAVTARGKAVLDVFGGERVLVYSDPTAHAVVALHTDATSATWDGKILRLSNGQRIENGVLFEPDGRRATIRRPLQVFTRWYGFSLTFPNTEIFGERSGR